MHRNEEETLFSLSASRLCSETADLVLKNRKTVDWGNVLEGARMLSSAGAVCTNLEHLGLWHGMHLPGKEHFRQLALERARENLIQLKHFVRITKKLNAFGIVPLPLKGIALNIDAYPTLDIRRSRDVDILLEKKDFRSATRLLKDSGYTEIQHTRNGRYLHYNQQAKLFQQGPNLLVDLHYRLFPWYVERHIYKLASEDILKRSGETDFEGCRIRCMDPTDRVLYTAMVLANEGYRSFKYYMDLDAVIRTHKSCIDWEALYLRCREAGFETKLERIFLFLSRRLRTPVIFRKSPQGSVKPHGMDFFSPTRRFHRRFFDFSESPTVKDKAGLALAYLRWRGYRQFGFFERDIRMRHTFS